jgi:ATP-dependent Clp protease ATP-binding subunit ClpC
MYERFTDRSRKVMQLANQQAQALNHEYIGTEHILLGLVKEGSGIAANVLKNLDVSLDRARAEVERLVRAGPDMVTMGKLPSTPRAKKVVEYAIEEARDLSHNYIGTEHLLLGLLREGEGIAAQVLTNLGVEVDEVREETLLLLGHDAKGGFATPRMPPPAANAKQASWETPLVRALGEPLLKPTHCKWELSADHRTLTAWHRWELTGEGDKAPEASAPAPDPAALLEEAAAVADRYAKLGSTVAADIARDIRALRKG